jgi:hypothetical protein
VLVPILCRFLPARELQVAAAPTASTAACPIRPAPARAREPGQVACCGCSASPSIFAQETCWFIVWDHGCR